MDPKWSPQGFPRRTPRGPQDDQKSSQNGTPLGANFDPEKEPKRDLKMEPKWFTLRVPQIVTEAPPYGPQKDK